jgi:hypothetical protein
MTPNNPLQGFFRKPKFSISLPSRGKWYPKNSLHSPDGTVDVYAMTAADDIRFKANEILISSAATYDLIRSCVPAIREPENMPVVDLDVVMLSIRRASRGDQISYETAVPNTGSTRTLTLSIQSLVESVGNVSENWDDQLTITDGDLSLHLVLKPVPVKTLFSTTKLMLRHQQAAERLSESDQNPDEKLDNMGMQLKDLSGITVGIVADSIVSISTSADYQITSANEIRQFVNQLDLEYFRVIQKHLEAQKKTQAFADIQCMATETELALGAPESWAAEINFSIANFFA